jgi:hypothetical protein
MKLHTYIQMGCCLLLLGATASCEQGLDLYSEDVISEPVYFASAGDFQRYANQFYSGLPSFNADDDMSDITKPSGFNNVSNSTYIAGTGDGTWDGAYSMIRYLNYGLDRCASAPENLQSDIKVYEAEMKFFRGFQYFALLKRFGGVPLIEKVLSLGDTDLLYGPRDSRETIADFILKNFNEAIPALPLESQIAPNDKGRISKGAAEAMKARFCLFEGTWRKFHGLQGGDAFLDEAISASRSILNSNEYELWDHRAELGDDSYRYFFTLAKTKSNPAGFTKVDNKEAILVQRYDENTRESPRYEHSGTLCPTKKLADMFLDNTGLPITNPKSVFEGYKTLLSEYQNRDPRMTTCFIKPEEKFFLFSQPMYNPDWNNLNDPNRGILYEVNMGFWTQTGYRDRKLEAEVSFPLGMDWYIIRLAEVMLIYAEATYEKAGSISDADLNMSINKLRDRVGMPHLTNAFVTDNGLNMREEIRRERTVELSLEGYRFDDLRRWKTAETELNQPLRGIVYKDTEYETDGRWDNIGYSVDAEGAIILEAASNRKFDPNKHYLFPLPTRQILLNPQLEQNPGW